MYIEKVTESNILDVMTTMFSKDEDFVGNNGDEYTTKEAVDAGYSSDAKYFAKRSFDRFEDTMDLEAMIYQMAEHFNRLHGNFWDVELTTETIDDSLILAVYSKQRV